MHFCKAYLVWDFKNGASCGTVWLGVKHFQESVNQTDKNQTQSSLQSWNRIIDSMILN